MNVSAGNPEVERAIGGSSRWRAEASTLREILLECGLTEELKWRKPCYLHEGKNICIIQEMKHFLALLFFRGALLKDPEGLLERQGPHSRSGFRMRFTGVREVTEAAGSIRAYVREAIRVEEAGLAVEKGTDVEYPDELVERFNADPDLKAAFERLTPGRRRFYLIHFSGAKKSRTRAARIERYRRKILDGKGFNDR